MAAGIGLAAGPRGGARRLERIGIQLYTVRELVQQDLEGTLAALREIGFVEVEFAGYPAGAEASAVRAMLSRVGLSAPAAHFGLDRIREGWDATMDFALGVGHRYVVVPSLPPKERRALDSYRRLADLMNRRGAEAARHGLSLGYHNHDFEFEPIDGTVPFDLLVDRCDPALVTFELDLYWAIRGGRDPLGCFARWPGRFPLLHVKDMERGAARGFTEVGRGRIDFARVFAASDAGGTRHFLYEQDQTPGPPLDSARRSFRYLRELEF